MGIAVRGGIALRVDIAARVGIAARGETPSSRPDYARGP